ncbi:type I restriction endonuclease subunit R [Calothrix sp. CCY 0018]|uniref:type I restriction endonuclease subunit R n=1 Tax=Calothrix sp. CCY 0018 TaxID=3103864 RepID=UPI0039C60AF3
MRSSGITKAITNLTQAHAKLDVSPSSDANFFTEWKEPLPTLSDAEKAKLELLKRRYLYYADSGAITEGTINLILLSPLLETLGFFDQPYQVRSEKYIRFEIEDGDTQLDGLIDALVIRDSLWLIVIESKRYGFSVRQAIPQTLAYMIGANTSPVFALITTGEDYLFIKCDRGGVHDSAHYALSDKFTLSTAKGNQLYTVAQILKQLVSV